MTLLIAGPEAEDGVIVAVGRGTPLSGFITIAGAVGTADLIIGRAGRTR